MQKSIYLILLLFFFCLSLFSQEDIEIQGGINITNLSDPGNLASGVKCKSKAGFIFSFSTNIPFSDGIYLYPGLRYIQKGLKAQLSSYLAKFLPNHITCQNINYV